MSVQCVEACTEELSYILILSSQLFLYPPAPLSPTYIEASSFCNILHRLWCLYHVHTDHRTEKEAPSRPVESRETMRS